MAEELETLSPVQLPQESQTKDGNPRLVTEIQDGQKVTVVRDTEDRIVYPTYVPPATRSPVSGRSPSSPTSPETAMSETNQNKAKGEQKQVEEKQQDVRDNQQETKYNQQEEEPQIQPPRKVQTEPTPRTSSPRPQARNWATEFPQPDRAFTLPPPPRRAGTNISAVPPGTACSSSDSSSSDDEDYNPPPSPKKKQHRRKKKKSKRQLEEEDEERFRKFKIGNPHYRTRGKVSKRDGRLSISLKDTSQKGYLAKALGTAAKRMVPLKPPPGGSDSEPSKNVAHFKGLPTQKRAPSIIDVKSLKPPKLNIVIMVIGSRGDAQPFLKIGKILKEKYGHRVRIATHPAFRDFVEQDSGLEFFSVGGDPSELMSFMVKNPGMIPTLSSVKAGDIQKRRAAMAEMFQGFWRACINATDDEHDVRNIKMMGRRDPFVADAIIANPPSFAHIHCAEALGIPLHLMFTFPYTPTQAFPHPLASIKKSNVDAGYTNFMSYPLVEMMVWQGLGDLVNEFRVSALGLDPVSTLWAPGATYRLHVPFTYLWSPGLVPKPGDWGEEVDVAGFVFLDLASSFKPPEDLVKFLEKSDQGKGEGEQRDEKPVVYIGFGSIVVDDANRFTEMIFEAVELVGVRALVSKGWGGLGGDTLDVPEDVHMLDNTPHDWLFPRVKACVIHGGAGTTAIALKCGKPTMIVPFFGDQHFWGTMVGNAGAGPEAVPYKNLTAEKLAEGIKYCLTDEAREAAEKIAKDIEQEGDGAENACDVFHKGLLIQREVKGGGRNSMGCSILPDQVAVWQMKETGLRLSSIAAEMLVERGLVSWKKLRLLRHNEWNDFEGPGEPVTGAAGSVMGTVGNVFGGIGGVPYRVAKSAKKRKDREKGKDKNKSKKSNGNDDKSQQNDNGQENGEELPQVETVTTHAIDDRRSGSSSIHTNPAEEVAHHVGRGALKSASAIAKAPVDLSVALAQGFHNAPRLYGDDTVRRPIRVTGIRSGLKAAKHEFAYGIYDGVTGVVRLPYRGAKEGGVGGFVRGVGMGLTGFVLKDLAAVIGLVGYTLKGVVKQVERGKQPIKYIRRARIVQGERDIQALSEEEKARMGKEAVKGWSIMWKLWDEMVRQEKKKRGRSIRAKLGGKTRRHHKRSEWDVVFESVEVAERALEALRKGGDMDLVLERVENERGSGHSPVSGTNGEPRMLQDVAAPETTEGRDLGAGKKEADAETTSTKVPSPPESNGVGSGTNETMILKEEEEKEKEEEENPFSVGTPAIAKNMEENRMAVEAIEVKV